MLKSFFKASAYVACLTWSGIVCAAGMGGINVASSLGQPLKAEIELVSIDRSEKSNLKAKLASAEAYKNALVDYPYGIPKLKFQIEERANGDPYISVTSSQPVNEPFVVLLVELNWSSGKLLREYTFLLDPPGYKAVQPQADEVKPIKPLLAEPMAAAEPVAAIPAESPAAVVAMPVTAPEAATAPAGETATETAAAPPVEGAETTVQAAEEELVSEEAAPEGEEEYEIVEEELSDSIEVESGETLSKIAALLKPENVSLERMVVALYRENAKQFGGHNMNRIRAGKILKIPDSDSINATSQEDAEELIRVQSADWEAYRQQLAGIQAASSDQVDRQEVSGKISTAVIEQLAPGKEAPKEVLKLSKGEMPDDKALTAGKASAQDKENAKQEEAIAKEKALKEAQQRAAVLEKNIQDMQRLAELKRSAGAVSAPQAASGVAEVKPEPKPAPKVAIAPPPSAPIAEPPSMVDEVLGEPLYLAAGAAVLLLLVGGGFVVVRRYKFAGGKKKVAPAEKVQEDEVGGSTGRMAAPVAASPDTGDFTKTAAPATAAAASVADEVDPISEADLFLTFGRDVQAEEVLKEALGANPGNMPVKLKLLSIYASRKDTNAFYTYAREIKDSGDESAWNQAAAMGRDLEPSNPYYGGEQSAAAEAASPSEVHAVDFDLGFGSATGAAVGQGNLGTVVMAAPAEATTMMSADDIRAAAQSAPMDFDVTGTHPGVTSLAAEAEQPASALDALAMDFDITGTPAGADSTGSSAIAMDFDITGTHPGMEAVSAEAQQSASSLDALAMDFDITGSLPGKTAETPVAAPAVDAGMGFSLDFPAAAASSKPAVATPDLGLGEISLNLDSLSSAPATTEPKGDLWNEVATKLDLAKAYQEMGDAAGAREILDEVMRDGDEQQRQAAQALLQQL